MHRVATAKPLRDIGANKVAEQQYRKERDSMGEFQVPADAYYGANTMRAKLNFPISDLRFPRSFIRALGQIKQAAAQVNSELPPVQFREIPNTDHSLRGHEQEVAEAVAEFVMATLG